MRRRDHAIGLKQPCHKIRCRRGHIEAADIDHPTFANHHTMGIEEEDIATDTPILISIEDTVDHRGLMMDHIDQRRCILWQVQVDGVARMHIEPRKRVEPGLTKHRAGAHIGNQPIDAEGSGSAAISDDLWLISGKGQRRKCNLQQGG